MPSFQIGRDRWPTASEAQQFANAMTDPKNAARSDGLPEAERDNEL
jgi:hypothetical protein